METAELRRELAAQAEAQKLRIKELKEQVRAQAKSMRAMEELAAKARESEGLAPPAAAAAAAEEVKALRLEVEALRGDKERLAAEAVRLEAEVGEARAYGNKMYSEASCARKETRRLVSELAAREVD